MKVTEFHQKFYQTTSSVENILNDFERNIVFKIKVFKLKIVIQLKTYWHYGCIYPIVFSSTTAPSLVLQLGRFHDIIGVPSCLRSLNLVFDRARNVKSTHFQALIQFFSKKWNTCHKTPGHFNMKYKWHLMLGIRAETATSWFRVEETKLVNRK